MPSAPIPSVADPDDFGPDPTCLEIWIWILKHFVFVLKFK